MIMKHKNSNSTNNNNEIDLTKIPKHIAIIMDGNGRWAQKRSLPRIAGHKAGVESLRDIIKTSSEIGVSHLTLYAFSTENWKRPVEEINGLLDLLVLYLRREVNELHKNNIKIQVIGDILKLTDTAITEIKKAINKTSDNSGLTVNIALNYGSRYEIVNAVKEICKSVIEDTINISDVNENLIENYLYTQNIPDPDLVIRTSGEIRVSNFLLWQIAYSELWFTDILWPDFTGTNLLQAIIDYQKRGRRFGGI